MSSFSNNKLWCEGVEELSTVLTERMLFVVLSFILRVLLCRFSLVLLDILEPGLLSRMSEQNVALLSFCHSTIPVLTMVMVLFSL